MNIYRALCKADGNLTPRYDEPAEVSAAGISGADARAGEALSLFATYLGRVAGDLALIFMAKGGVFLAGGISPKSCRRCRAASSAPPSRTRRRIRH